MRRLTKIIIHHSASDYPIHDNVETIRDWHKSKGFTDIGYHYLITKDGSICTGRPVEKVGAHCRGHNKDSVGVCLTGKDFFSLAQFMSLDILIEGLCNYWGISRSQVFTHRNFADTLCPNFIVKDYFAGSLEEQILYGKEDWYGKALEKIKGSKNEK
jgi:N-acetyl-anhydromuramyl-L-alanine amidase AmpD